MAMALANLFRAAVYHPCQRTFSKQTRPGAESHRAAHLFDVNQIAELENDRVRRFKIEFGRVRVFKVTDVARELNAGGLHAQTNSEVRSARAPRVRDRSNHSFDAALANTAGNQDRDKVAQTGF